MNYGFVVDNRSCIGCHACSTACKSENDVPLGVARTWVKYVEQGTFPDVRRSFQVTRCNHCDNPPCVAICPTAAMHQRDDGIVQFDSDACIGCKACMQACPYDSIHLDPQTKTAAKCHYCAHRVDVGLEPACVVVCPEHAIIAGDLDDPTSEISRVLAGNNTTVRKPEQGTRPNLFYIDGNELALSPTALDVPKAMLWSDVREAHDHVEGPIVNGGRVASQMVSYNQQHEVPWHWPIPAYVITKHVAGGVFLYASLATLAGAPVAPSSSLAAGALALAMLAITFALLIYDLDRPDRFFYLLVRPQWRSWVARAAWILGGFAAVATAWWGLQLVVELPAVVHTVFALVTAPLAMLAATYTAFLLAQAEGRDLWQAPHIPLQMGTQALAFGALPFAVLGEPGAATVAIVSLAASLVTTVIGDVVVPVPTDVARSALDKMLRGPYRHHYWLGGIVLGHLVPLVLLGASSSLAAIALVAAALGLFAYAYAFVMAPQHVPNS